MTYPPDRTRIQETEDVTTPVIVDTIREVAMIGDTTVVIVAVTKVTQITVAALLLDIE